MWINRMQENFHSCFCSSSRISVNLSRKYHWYICVYMCILNILFFYYLLSYEKIPKKYKKKSLSDNSNIYFILELESVDSLFPYELLYSFSFIQFLVHSLSRVWLFVIPWTAPCQASLSITNSSSLMSSNSCPLNQWCHPTISSSVVPFSFCLQSFPASGSFPMSQLFASRAKILDLQPSDQSLQWIFRIDLL